jgi:hypothetical protein
MKLTTTKKTILLAVAFEIVWLTLVMTANSDLYWAGPVIGLLAYGFILRQQQKYNMVLPLMGAALIGFGFDLMLHYMGVITLYSNALSFSWLLVLWLVFVGVFYQLFSWLTNLSTVSSFVTGAIGGLAAYYGASLLGAVQIHNQTVFVVLYGLFWGVAFSLAAKIFVARKLTSNKRSLA